MAECVLPVPTTAVFNGFPQAPVKLPVKLHYFGDRYEYQTILHDRDIWMIPIRDGEFIIDEEIGCVQGVGRGNFLVMWRDQKDTFTAAQAAVEIIHKMEGIATSFPSGVVGSGSKIGSKKYKFLKASTNDAFFPTLKDTNPNSMVTKGVNYVFEIVIKRINETVVRRAIADGIHVVCHMPEAIYISTCNYGGTLGSYKFYFREILAERPYYG